MKCVIPGKIIALVALVAITGFSAYSYVNYQFDPRYQKDDVRGAVAYIKKNINPDDTILCLDNMNVFNRYSKDNFKCNTFYTSDSSLTHNTRGKKRLWVVTIRLWYINNQAFMTAKRRLDSKYREIRQLHRNSSDIAGIQIYCYDVTDIAEE